MEPDFWHDRWTRHQIGFHEDAVNPLLVEHFASLGELPAGSRVFIPLSGKSLDIDWLLARGLRVVGIELSPIAVRELHERVGHPPELDMVVGDLFDLTPERVGIVDAVYDRAALIALPVNLRRRYVPHVRRLTNGAPQLLVTLDYDQRLVAGPPFSLSDEELTRLYGDYERVLLSSRESQLKGKYAATERTWLLRSR